LQRKKSQRSAEASAQSDLGELVVLSPLRVDEATTEKKASGKQSPYEGRKPQTRARAKENAPTRHNFRMDLKKLIAIPNVADRLKSPPKTDKRLGPSKNT